MTKKLHINQ